MEKDNSTFAVSKKDWKLALIDLDGTLFRESEPVPGAASFIERLRKKGTQPVFFTNNSTRTPEQVIEKLEAMGIHGHAHEVCTSAQATAAYILSQHGAGAHVCYLGTSGLKQAFLDAGLEPVSAKLDISDEVFDKISAAVVGLDTDVHYQHFARLCKAAYRLQSFILTNPDVRLPVENGFLPGNGALGAFVACATGLNPIVIGKPQSTFVEFALSKYHAAKEETFIVGDNLLTDIAVGNQAGIYSIHVQSGVVQKQIHGFIPDEVCTSVADLFI